jgi:hypothetical protein
MRALPIAVVVTLVAACGARPTPTPTPHNTPIAPRPAAATGGGPLVGAEVIELRDVWVGLGCTHDFSARLTAAGAEFTGAAELNVGWGHDQAATKIVTVPRAVIAALEAAAEEARAGMATAAPPVGASESGWTDDYPTGSMTFTGAAGVHRLAFTDQHRVLHWEHDGERAPLDVPHDVFEDKSSAVWGAYTAVLDAAGMRAWIDAACDRP